MELIDTWHGDQPLSDVLADATTELPDSLDNAHLSEERRAILQAFLDIARGHLELERRATVDDFLSSLRTDDRVSAVTDGVELGTFHSAKGSNGRSCTWSASKTVTSRSDSPRAPTPAPKSGASSTLPPPAPNANSMSPGAMRVIGDQLVEREPSPWIEAFRGEPDPLPDERPSIANLRAKIAAVPEVDLTVTDRHDARSCVISCSSGAKTGLRKHTSPPRPCSRIAPSKPSRSNDHAGWTNSPTSRASARAKPDASASSCSRSPARRVTIRANHSPVDGSFGRAGDHDDRGVGAFEHRLDRVPDEGRPSTLRSWRRARRDRPARCGPCRRGLARRRAFARISRGLIPASWARSTARAIIDRRRSPDRRRRCRRAKIRGS